MPRFVRQSFYSSKQKINVRFPPDGVENTGYSPQIVPVQQHHEEEYLPFGLLQQHHLWHSATLAQSHDLDETSIKTINAGQNAHVHVCSNCFDFNALHLSKSK